MGFLFLWSGFLIWSGILNLPFRFFVNLSGSEVKKELCLPKTVDLDKRIICRVLMICGSVAKNLAILQNK